MLESLQRPRLVSPTARRSTAAVEPAFVPAVVPEPEVTSERGGRTSTSTASVRMVIVLAKGQSIVVDAGVDAAALARVLDVLDRR